MSGGSEVYRTPGGRALSDGDIEALADEAEIGYDPAKFVRREREHLDVLHERLDHLQGDRPRDPNYHPGEAHALAWALGVITEETEPIHLRVDRIDKRLRTVEARLGRVEADLREPDEL